METIHLFVELLDQYFSNVCEVSFECFRMLSILPLPLPLFLFLYASCEYIVGYSVSLQQGVRAAGRVHFGWRGAGDEQEGYSGQNERPREAGVMRRKNACNPMLDDYEVHRIERCGRNANY